jgi:hypothetical protein
MGKPVLRAAFGAEVVPGTAMADFGSRAPHLDEHGDLRVQLDQALATHGPDLSRHVAGRVFTEPHGATHRLRTDLYERLRLPVPTPTPVRVWPPAQPEWTAARSFVVYTDVAVPGVVVVRRYPAAVATHPEAETATLLQHMVSYEDEPDQDAIDSASLIVAIDGGDEVLHRHLGAYLAVTSAGEGWEVVTRDGRAVLVTFDRSAAEDGGLLAVVVVAAMRRAGALPDAVEVRAGARTLRMRFREEAA